MSLLLAPHAGAAGKKRRAAPETNKPIKRAIELDPIADRYIEIPDPAAPLVKYGGNIQSRLIDDLMQTRDYAVLVGKDAPATVASSSASAELIAPDPCIIPKLPVASAKVSIAVRELSFAVGSRAARTFYGFTPEHENRYNAGIDERALNEFPVKKLAGDPDWFENVFDDYGDLHTGFELGHEINFDVLLVGAKLKHTPYDARLGLDVVFTRYDGRVDRREVVASGNGFYYDFSAHFGHQAGDFGAGIMIARKAALYEAFGRTMKRAVETIGDEIAKLPLVAKLAAQCDGSFYLGAGADYRVPLGQRFYDATQLQAGLKASLFVVADVFLASSRLKVESGEGFSVGDELVSLKPGEKPPEPISRAAAALGLSSAGSVTEAIRQEIDAGSANVSLPSALGRFVESYLKRLWEGVKALVTLPYRIWRWFQYDQKYKGGELWQVGADRALLLARRSWAALQIGLPEVFAQCRGRGDCLGSRAMLVAVIDSGIDYNHRELRRNIFWDGLRDTPGFDFFSYDPRPYDDHAHGTEVASVIAGGGAEIVGVAPNVTLIPVKAFSPYGLTNSSALLSSFQYAIAQGARIIVAGWGTERASQALYDGVKLAEARGVLVIAAAGDGGVDLEKRPYYPAAYSSSTKNMIVVAGHARDGGLTRSPGMYSNYGSTVDLAAPGDSVRVGQPRDSYKTRSNSGIAAGFVAGSAALAWSRCLKASMADVKTALLDGARSLDGLKGEVPGNRSLFLPGAMQSIDQICK